MEADNNKGKQIINASAKNLVSEEDMEKVLICKICLSEENQVQRVKNGLISPCSCTGSMQYVHRNCICTWMQLKWKETNELSQMTCELCLAPLSYQIQTKYDWKPFPKIKAQISDKFFTFLMLMVAILGLSAFFGIMIIILVLGTKFQEFMIFLTIVSMIFLICCLQYLVQKYFQEESIKSISVYDKQEK